MEHDTIWEYDTKHSPPGGQYGAGDPAVGVFSNVSEDITERLFKKDTLDRRLMRKHLAGKSLPIYYSRSTILTQYGVQALLSQGQSVWASLLPLEN